MPPSQETDGGMQVGGEAEAASAAAHAAADPSNSCSSAAAAAAAADVDVDVLIVGGGPAGIGAAMELQRQGRTCIVVEARSYIGGRVRTRNDLGVPLDIGASWIHHYGRCNPLAREAWANRSTLGVPAGGRDLWLGATPSEPVAAADLRAAGALHAQLEEARDQAAHEHNQRCHPKSPFVQSDWDAYCRCMSGGVSDGGSGVSGGCGSGLDSTCFHDRQPGLPCTEHDQSIAEWVATQPMAREMGLGRSDAAANGDRADAAAQPRASAVLRALMYDIEQYEGAPLSLLSATHGGEQMCGLPGADMQVASGYGALLESIAEREQLRVHHDTVVTHIQVGLESVRVDATRVDPQHQQTDNAHGSSTHPVERPAPPADPRTLPGTRVSYRARFVIVTVPLGVLQREHMSFSPPLPRWKRDAIHAMGFGLLNKTILQFDRAWWDEELEPESGDHDADADAATVALSRSNVINVLPAAGSDEPPLWIVSLSRTLTAAQNLHSDHPASAGTGATSATGSPASQSASSRRDAAWQALMSNARPLAPSCQLEDSYVAGNIHADACSDPSPSLEPSCCAPSASLPSPVPSTTTSAPSLDGSPHVLVSFSACFDTASPSGGEFSASSAEAQPDSVIVDTLMRRLRRAYGDDDQDDECRTDSVRVLSVDADAEVVQRQRLDDDTAPSACSLSDSTGGAPAAAGTTALSVPTSFSFSAPRYSSLKRRGQAGRRTANAGRAVPDPIGYVVTRWGLESHAHGAYAHFRPGAGPHTCAQLARPVRVQLRQGAAKIDGVTAAESQLECVEEEADECCCIGTGTGSAATPVPLPSDVQPATSSAATVAASASASSCPCPSPSPARLLWAGEATLGVHLGCADSAWLSGLREAKRIAAYWTAQGK